MEDYKSLIDLIISRKNEENKGVTFILGDTDEEFVSYQELYHTSLKILYIMQEMGTQTGDEIIFQIEDNKRFIFFFWACILGGFIPVPLSAGINDEHKMKLLKVWKILNNPKLIISRDLLGKLENFVREVEMPDIMESIKRNSFQMDDLTLAEKQGKIAAVKSDDIAFIQFSSGSTGDPKGVIITHQNVLINLSAVIKYTHIDTSDVALNWMPLTHDMGLIGTHIKSVLANINQYNIHTSLFIKRPTLWMEKASEHRATMLYSPNFGYKHFLKFMPDNVKKAWNLSRVRLIFNGAEPISVDLCNEFLDKMAAYGLKRNAMYPVYGLAEGTIAVTFPTPGEEFSFVTLNRDHLGIGASVKETSQEDPKNITFINEGYPIYNCYIRICDDENRDLGEDKVGYIQIKGGNVTSGYYNNKEATERAITPDGWLNTGDLGFLRNKRLIVTGRAKDVIFMAGQNYYSHDIERIAENVEGIELGKIAAVGIFNEKTHCDELVLFLLFKQKIEKFLPLVRELKKVISNRLGIEVAQVIPVKNIPKTTSGKIQRYKLRENYLNRDYNSVISEITALLNAELENSMIFVPQTRTEEKLAQIWSEVLGQGKANVSSLRVHDDFFEGGGDSLKATQLLARIRESFQVELDHLTLSRTPTITGLARLIDQSGKMEIPLPELSLRPFSSEEGLPLSFAQQRLWFLDRLNNQSPQYNLYIGIRFAGDLEPELLEKSFNEIIKRHKILQVYFMEKDGVPFQMVNPKAEIHLPVIDLSNMPEKERESNVQKIAREVTAKPFQLEEAPLFRGILFRIEKKVSILVLAAHHIIFDGWSFGVLIKDLAFCYENLNTGNNRKISPLKVQYFDFVNWQEQRSRGEKTVKQLEYWKEQLKGRLPVLELPADKPRPVVQTFTGAKFIINLPASLLNDLKQMAEKEEVTLFMLLLAAFKILLFRYSGGEDLIVGVPAANRNHKDFEELIGFFTNNLVLRTNLSGKMRFREFLARVKQVTLEALSNQEITFERLVEELHPERNINQNPLFQVFFSLQNTPFPIQDFCGISMETIDFDNGFSRFDLSLDLWEANGVLKAVFEYNTDLFFETTIARFAGHYQRVLSEILRHPALELDKIEILTEKEREVLLYEWNNTSADFPIDTVWMRLFENQAQKTPDATAVIAGEKQLTYREFNTKANQLANYLISIGVGPEVIVGIYTERSLEMLISLLGIHKAGGAYLPLDPMFPRERLSYMIEHTGISVLLTQKSLLSVLPDHKARVICLDDETAFNEIFQKDAVNPDQRCYLRARAHNLAYLIYTSGSTGRPKGVQIEHHALTNFLLAMREKIMITELDSLLAVTTLSFDIAGLELLLPLVAGAKVVLANREEAANGELLIEKLNKHDISIMQATPATWRMIIESGWSGKSNLKVLCGGEALPSDLANALQERAPIIYNMFGPTETTIWSTMARISSRNEPITIGRPIANTKVYILDSAMNPLPVGVPGELYIAGEGLARGYLYQPELTAEKFVPNPFYSEQCSLDISRMYKTGDLAKFLPGGSIEFCGRIDNQVKIRGYRIELGEIEFVLNSHPAIQSSVVAAKEVYRGEKSLIAYFIPVASNRNDELSNINLRKYLKEKLPDYMVPAIFVELREFPMTPNGKIDRKALPVPESPRTESEEKYIAPANEIEKGLIAIWREVLKMNRIGIHDNFFDLGGHSLFLSQVQSKIRKSFKCEIPILDLFRYPTIDALAKRIEQELKGDAIPGNTAVCAGEGYKRDFSRDNDIAIIGLSGRFPGAKNIDEFWKNLCDGVESIRRFSDQEIIAEGVDPALVNDPYYVKAWGVLDDAEKFDAQFFGYNPREAEILDPQQRIFLEESWKALEDAGYDAEKFAGRIGVFAGVGMNTYLNYLKDSKESDHAQLANDYQIMISNDKDFLATRISYKLNLEGPGITVQTACSTSLVAVHLACRSLLEGECDLALAGGVSIRLPQKTGYLFQEGMILSPDGHCRAFDENAKGTVGGNGAGVVVLKRLKNALEDGDHIAAVIKGSAVNNDGAKKIGYTAPRIDGQAGVIAAAQEQAGIDPETITYIEAHGTGTPLGDPIEIEALTQAFRRKTSKKKYCAVGSVKTNVGHLDAAAGVTGLIKTILALQNKKIPPSLHYERPNPKIDFDNSPFFVNAKLTEWKGSAGIRRAGVSSFGIGGTNAHVILEEAPVLKQAESQNPYHLLIFSAKSAAALEQATENFRKYLKQNPGLDIGAAAYTLQVGRREFDYRRMLVCSSQDDAVSALETMDPKKVASGNIEQGNRRLVFMFPGQGSQYAGMAKELYLHEPVFRRELDRCAGILEKFLGLNLCKIFYPDEAAAQTATEQLKNTAITQPALFVIEYALAKLWESWGVSPWAMIGHSIGEYVAACMAGVFSLDDALYLVAERGRLMQQLPFGAMLAVSASESEARLYLNDELSLAAINSPALCVISGTLRAINQLELLLREKGVWYSRLHTSHAFHSHMMEPILKAFSDVLHRIKLSKPELPYISNLTGAWVKPEDAASPEYWTNHLRQTVKFSSGIQVLAGEPDLIFLEVGPGNTLSTLVKQQLKNSAGKIVLSSLSHPREVQSEQAHILHIMGKLWLGGLKLNWEMVNSGRNARRISLPTYPFESKPYWVHKNRVKAQVKKYGNSSERFYAPVWKQSVMILPFKPGAEALISGGLVLYDDYSFTKRFVERLQLLAPDLILVKAGTYYQRVDADHFVIDLHNPGHYDVLIQELGETKRPGRIISLLGVTPNKSLTVDGIDESNNRLFYSLLYLVQAVNKNNWVHPLVIKLFSNNLFKIGGEDYLAPEKAVLLGPLKVIPQEYPHIGCNLVDFTVPLAERPQEELLNQLIVETFLKTNEEIVVYRGGERWTPQYETLLFSKPYYNAPHINTPYPEAITLRNNGVYLITGGLGGIGLVLAEYLAREVQAKLILVGRSAFPVPGEWEQWLAGHAGDDAIANKIRKLKDCQALGAEIMIRRADVADFEQIKAVIDEAYAKYGGINGIIHAAGIPGGGMIQLKTRESAERVMQPKIKGTIALYEATKEKQPDFIIFCSSINGITGGFGQIDYCAANAFMDAFAKAHDSRYKTRFISINWDRWPGVGMADGNGLRLSSYDEKEVHPLLGKCIIKKEDRAIFQAEFTPETLWVLSEHLVLGNPTIAGTTYLEMARAAFGELQSPGARVIEISEVVFLTPLAVKEGEKREVFTILDKKGDAFEFLIVSKLNPEREDENSRWEEHVRGKIRQAAETRTSKNHLPEIIKNFNERMINVTNARQEKKEEFITFGNRWNSLKRYYLDQNEGLAELELGGEYSNDLQQYKLHPALLDVATGTVRIGKGNYLPFSYEKLFIKGDLPLKLYSHIRIKNAAESSPEVITCEIDIFDADGVNIVEITNFSMRRVSEETAAGIKAGINMEQRGDFTGLAKLAVEIRNLKSGLQIGTGAMAGLTMEEGRQSFRQILKSGFTSQIIVSTKDIETAVEEAKYINQRGINDVLDEAATSTVYHPRPELNTEYVSPKNENEAVLAEIMQKVLGVEKVGIHDDFFELGGNSLLLVQLHSKLKERFKTNIAVVDLYKYTSVASLDRYFNQTNNGEPPVFQEVNQRVNKQIEAMKQRRQQMMKKGR